METKLRVEAVEYGVTVNPWRARVWLGDWFIGETRFYATKRRAEKAAEKIVAGFRAAAVGGAR